MKRVQIFLLSTIILGVCFGIVNQGERGSNTKIVLLGTGTPNAEPDRSGSSVAIVVNDTPYIVDFGPGIVRRAVAAYQNGIKALKPSILNIAFLTHLHSDHTAGYPDLIFTPWVLERKRPLKVFGPPGIRAMTEHILKAYEEDIHVRLHGLERATSEGYQVDVHEIEPGIVYSDKNITVKAFPVHHGAWKHAFGFRFETADRIIVVSGDRSPKIDITEHCKGCDVLVHEVYSVKGFKTRPPKWKAYHADSHTSSLDVGRLAAMVKPRLLVLYHQLLWGATPDELLDEIRQVYDGKVVYGNDLDVY